MILYKMDRSFMVTLFSTNCPRCKVLERKLMAAGIKYTVSYDIQEVIDAGFKSAPILKVDNKYYNFKEGVDWINNEN